MDSRPLLYNKLYANDVNEISDLCSTMIKLVGHKINSVMELYPATGRFSYEMALRKWETHTVFDNNACKTWLENTLTKSKEINKLPLTMYLDDTPRNKFDLVFCANPEIFSKYVLSKSHLVKFLAMVYKRLRNDGCLIYYFGLVKDAYSLPTKRKITLETTEKDITTTATISILKTDYLKHLLHCNYFIKSTNDETGEEVSSPISKDIVRSLFTINDFMYFGKEAGFECSLNNGFEVLDGDISKESPFIVFRKND